MERVDVIIPTYKPDWKFLDLLEKLSRQSVPVHRIIIMNTEQKYFDRLVYGTPFVKKYPNVLVRHLSKREFDHGRTRNSGVRHSDAEIFIMMTQDAVPADEFLVEELLKGLHSGENTAVAYARQLAQDTSSEVEKFTRNFNYPEEAAVKTKADIDKLGIKAFFCSNVCAAYKREIFDSLGGFIKHTIFNEDMIYARGLLDAGYLIAYEARAVVIHSHNYSALGQFKRNFDLGVSHALYPQVFEGLPAESEGIRLVKKSSIYVLRKGKPWLIAKLFWQSGFKYLGYFLGRRYRLWPKSVVKAFSMNKEFW